MKKTPRKRTKPTASAVANNLGIARSTLYAWRDAGAPVDRGEAAVLEWALAESKRSKEPDDIKSAKLAVLLQTARRLTTANDQKAGLLIDVVDVKRQVAQTIGALHAGTYRLAAELPPQLEGRSAVEIGTIISLRVDQIWNAARIAFADLAGEALPQDQIEAGRVAVEKYVATANGRIAFVERCQSDYKMFRRWLGEIETIRSEKRGEWCRLRAAAKLPVPDATDAEVAAYGVRTC